MDLSNFISFYVNDIFNELSNPTNTPPNIPANIANRPNSQANSQANSQTNPLNYETDKFRPKEPEPTDDEPEIIEFNWEGFDISNTIKIHLSTI